MKKVFVLALALLFAGAAITTSVGCGGGSSAAGTKK
jgi:hypothetical protein